jgi:tight adherence protein B
MTPSSFVALLFGAMALFCAGLWQWNRGAAQRAEVVARTRPGRGEPATRRRSQRLDLWLRRTRGGAAVEARLAASGVDLTVIQFVALVAATVAAGAVLAGQALPPPVAAFGGVASGAACFGYLGYRRRKRTEEFVAQLPDLARVLSNAASAGLSMPRAISLAVGEVSDPARTVLRRVADELRLGQSVDGALLNLERRVPSREVGVLVSTLVIQQRAGGDVVHALRDMASALDARKDLRREVRTIMAGAIATSYLVPGLGIASLLMLNGMAPGTIARMVHSPAGCVALVIGLGLYAIGFALVRRTTRIET